MPRTERAELSLFAPMGIAREPSYGTGRAAGGGQPDDG